MSLVDIFQFKSVYLYTIEDLGLHITEGEGGVGSGVMERQFATIVFYLTS